MPRSRLKRAITSALWITVGIAVYVTLIAWMQNRDLADRLTICERTEQ